MKELSDPSLDESFGWVKVIRHLPDVTLRVAVAVRWGFIMKALNISRWQGDLLQEDKFSF